MWLKLDHTYNKSAEKMNQTVDHILIIALDENISYEEKRNRIAKLISDNQQIHRQTETDINRETLDDTLPRFEFRDIEED